MPDEMKLLDCENPASNKEIENLIDEIEALCDNPEVLKLLKEKSELRKRLKAIEEELSPVKDALMERMARLNNVKDHVAHIAAIHFTPAYKLAYFKGNVDLQDRIDLAMKNPEYLNIKVQLAPDIPPDQKIDFLNQYPDLFVVKDYHARIKLRYIEDIYNNREEIERDA